MINRNREGFAPAIDKLCPVCNGPLDSAYQSDGNNQYFTAFCRQRSKCKSFSAGNGVGVTQEAAFVDFIKKAKR